MGFEGEHTRDAYQYRTSVEPEGGADKHGGYRPVCLPNHGLTYL